MASVEITKEMESAVSPAKAVQKETAESPKKRRADEDLGDETELKKVRVEEPQAENTAEDLVDKSGDVSDEKSEEAAQEISSEPSDAKTEDLVETPTVAETTEDLAEVALNSQAADGPETVKEGEAGGEGADVAEADDVAATEADE